MGNESLNGDTAPRVKKQPRLYGPDFDETVREKAKTMFREQPFPLGHDHVSLQTLEIALAHRIASHEICGQPRTAVENLIDSALATHKPFEQWMRLAFPSERDYALWSIARTATTKVALANGHSNGPVLPQQHALAQATNVQLRTTDTCSRATIRLAGTFYKGLIALAVQETHDLETSLRKTHNTVESVTQYISDVRREKRNAILEHVVQLGLPIRLWVPTHTHYGKEIPGHMTIVKDGQILSEAKTFKMLYGKRRDHQQDEALIEQILEVDPQEI